MTSRTPPIKAINLDEKNHEIFKDLTQNELSPFYKGTIKDVFLAAASLGFRHKLKAPLKKKKDTIPYRTLAADEENLWLVYSIAVADRANLEILLDKKEIFGIVEEYANGGIGLLSDGILDGKPGDPEKWLEAECIKIAKGNVKNK